MVVGVVVTGTARRVWALSGPKLNAHGTFVPKLYAQG